MPDADGVAAIRQIIRESPAARVIALTLYREEQYVLDAIRAGARGYLLKTVDTGELIAAVEAVHGGQYLIDPIIAARVLSELHLVAPKPPRVEPLSSVKLSMLKERVLMRITSSSHYPTPSLDRSHHPLRLLRVDRPPQPPQAGLDRLRHGGEALDPADHRLSDIQMPDGVDRQSRQYDRTV